MINPSCLLQAHSKACTSARWVWSPKPSHLRKHVRDLKHAVNLRFSVWAWHCKQMMTVRNWDRDWYPSTHAGPSIRKDKHVAAGLFTDKHSKLPADCLIFTFLHLRFEFILSGRGIATREGVEPQGTRLWERSQASFACVCIRFCPGFLVDRPALAVQRIHDRAWQRLAKRSFIQRVARSSDQSSQDQMMVPQIQTSSFLAPPNSNLFLPSTDALIF